METQDRRRDVREVTPYTALYCSYNGVRAVRIKDISRSGAAIIFKNPIQVALNENIIIHFYSRDIGKLMAQIQCKVVRGFKEDEQFAIGVEFQDNVKGIEEIMNYLSEHNHNN